MSQPKNDPFEFYMAVYVAIQRNKPAHLSTQEYIQRVVKKDEDLSLFWRQRYNKRMKDVVALQGELDTLRPAKRKKVTRTVTKTKKEADKEYRKVLESATKCLVPECEADVLYQAIKQLHENVAKIKCNHEADTITRKCENVYPHQLYNPAIQQQVIKLVVHMVIRMYDLGREKFGATIVARLATLIQASPHQVRHSATRIIVEQVNSACNQSATKRTQRKPLVQATNQLIHTIKQYGFSLNQFRALPHKFRQQLQVRIK